MIPEGEYILNFNFTGVIELQTRGLSSYNYQHREDSSTRYLIASKFEPTSARKMFPCFDEPDMKATFKLTLIHEDNYTALSNMPVETTMPLTGNMIKTTFEESAKMSTYLLSFVLSDFDYIEGDYKGKKVRAYAAPDRIQEAEHGLNQTIKFLEIYEEFFDVQYPIPKLDSVAIPNYASSGMEHWGLIIYKETSFLVNKEDLLHKRMNRVDRTISHELAHQWFGNLVTLKWWNDLLINEALSNSVMFIPLRKYYPKTDQIVMERMTSAMLSDWSIYSHPVRKNANKPREIEDLFNRFSLITYRKGGSVLRMLKYAMQDDYRKGVSNYLKKYAFQNAEVKYLWEELSKASSTKLNVTEIMDTWTLQMGFPYVELKRSNGTLEATQRWFLKQKNDTTVALFTEKEKLSPFGFIWKIPLIYKNLATGSEHILWLNERNATFKISAMQDDVLKFNPGFVGYYFVKYDKDDYQRLAKCLQENHTVFTSADRYNLLYEAIQLAQSDRLSHDIPLGFTKYLMTEKEHYLWKLFMEYYNDFLQKLDKNSETVKLLKEYIKYLTADLYDEILRGENCTMHFQKLQNYEEYCGILDRYEHSNFFSDIEKLACQSGNEKCIKRINNELDSWIQGNNITMELDRIFSLAIPYNKNNTLWDILYERFADENSTEKHSILSGLAMFTGRQEIMKTIDVLMQDTSIKRDGSWDTVVRQLARNDVALPILWNYIKTNWDSLLQRFDAKSFPTHGTRLVCTEFRTLREFEDLTEFLKTAPQIDDNQLWCKQLILDAISWSNKHEETLLNWLRSNVP